MKHPNQICKDDFIMAQIEDQRSGHLFFISYLTFEDFVDICNRQNYWKILSIVRDDEEFVNE